MVVKAYALWIAEQYHALCQSTASGANSTDKQINQLLIQQAQSCVKVRYPSLENTQPLISWQKQQLNSDSIQSISSFIKKTIPEDFYSEAYFDISHSESRTSHYFNKLTSLFHQDKIALQKQRWLAHTIDIFGWYFQFYLPGQKILSLGCGSGYELFFLRYHYPDAEIVAVDWVNKVPKSVLEKLNIHFFEANVYEFLDAHQGEYDLIYSSHVLEHSYQIDRLLELLNQALMPGGILVSSIPLCGFEHTQYATFLENILERKVTLKQLDCTLLDLGHPWKTNQYDLYHSLMRAQFQKIEVFGNENSCVRGIKISLSRWRQQASFMFRLHTIVLGSLKSLIYLFVSDPLPHALVNLNCNLDWKLPFGGGRIANFVPEVLFVAHKAV